MELTIDEIRTTLLSLPEDERAILAEELCDSLSSLRRDDIEKLWIVEAKRRIEEIVSGKVEPIDSEIVFKRVRDRAWR